MYNEILLNPPYKPQKVLRKVGFVVVVVVLFGVMLYFGNTKSEEQGLLKCVPAGIAGEGGEGVGG